MAANQRAGSRAEPRGPSQPNSPGKRHPSEHGEVFCPEEANNSPITAGLVGQADPGEIRGPGKDHGNDTNFPYQRVF